MLRKRKRKDKTMEFLDNSSVDYFHGRISLLNTFDVDLNKRLKHFLKIILTNKQTHNFARYRKLITNDTAHTADFTFLISGEADWALTDHLFDIFMQPLDRDERKEFYELLLNHPQNVFIDLDEYEPERFLLHEITGYLSAYRDDNGDPVLYLKDYYYNDFDFTAYNMTRLGFEDGIYENSKEYYRLAKELVLSKPVRSIWKTRYHKDRIDLLFGLRALIRGKDHQGVILVKEVKDLKPFLAKINKALKKSQA